MPAPHLAVPSSSWKPLSGILAVPDSANDAEGDPPVVGMLNRGYTRVAEVPHGFHSFPCWAGSLTAGGHFWSDPSLAARFRLPARNWIISLVETRIIIPMAAGKCAGSEMPGVSDGETEDRYSRGRMPPLGGRRGGCPGCSPRERGPRAPLYRDGAAERDGEPIEGSTMVARPRNPPPPGSDSWRFGEGDDKF